jgi:plastocyanin
VDGMGDDVRVKRVVIAVVALLSSLWLAPATAQTQAPGVEHLHFRFGPLHIKPGQNDIDFAINNERPPVDGWIVGFRPDLKYADGSGTPRVDVIHLHHGVWISNVAPEFAAGEEKTRVTAPPGYGWRYRTSDSWVMNYMIHNLTPTPTDVYITYDLDFIPDGSPAAAGIQEVRTLWLDVVGGIYPVFNVYRNPPGRKRYVTYPDGVRGAPRNRFVVQQDGVLVATAGHLHPGGLWTTLKLTRGGRTVTLFRSRAHYFEPAGAVSWDVAMGATPSTWRVGVRRGDVLSISATYDTRRASWYEVMGIMPVAYAAGGTGPDPFTTNVNVPGVLTHGHLPENRNHGGGPFGLPNPRRILAAPAGAGRTIAINDFTYAQGDLNSVGRRGRVPVVRPGGTLRFVNRDNRRDILHTITACRAPCNRSTGIAYPIANGPATFDSGDLGTGPPGRTAAAQRLSWRLPRSLKPGTYTYFCRIHPFMRGAFRVQRSRR